MIWKPSLNQLIIAAEQSGDALSAGIAVGDGEMGKSAVQRLDFATLKAKQRTKRSGFPEPLGLRVHRAISWLGRAEKEKTDHDVRFILLWVGFNSAYATEIPSDSPAERDSFKSFFETLVSLDSSHRIYDAAWERFSQEIRSLLANEYVYAPFWHHKNGIPGYANWQERLQSSKRLITASMKQFDTAQILAIVFDRLYVLRNQLVHGGATWDSSINRSQVRDGAAVLGCMLPLFIDIMMDNPDRDWGKPYYPVVESRSS